VRVRQLWPASTGPLRHLVEAIIPSKTSTRDPLPAVKLFPDVFHTASPRIAWDDTGNARWRNAAFDLRDTTHTPVSYTMHSHDHTRRQLSRLRIRLSWMGVAQWQRTMCGAVSRPEPARRHPRHCQDSVSVDSEPPRWRSSSRACRWRQRGGHSTLVSSG